MNETVKPANITSDDFRREWRSKGSIGAPGTERYQFNFGDMAEVITRCIDNLACVVHSTEWTTERQEFTRKLTSDVWEKVCTLSIFTRPVSWGVDFIDQNGAFGIIMSGQYTGLVNVRGDGSVSSHT